VKSNLHPLKKVQIEKSSIKNQKLRSSQKVSRAKREVGVLHRQERIHEWGEETELGGYDTAMA